jgi:hypothetical protein
VAGIVYVGSADDKLYALNATDGSELWSYLTGDWVVSSPAVVGGVVYVGSYDHLVYAIGVPTQTLQNQPDSTLVIAVIVVLVVLVEVMLGGYIVLRRRRIRSLVLGEPSVLIHESVFIIETPSEPA